MGDPDRETERLLFNMKLRIFYLEEKLAKQSSAQGAGAGGGASAHQEHLDKQLFELRLTLEERGQEVLERNELLVKARKAIEDLQADLILARERLSGAEQQQRGHAALQQQVLALEAREHSRMRELGNVSGTVRDLEAELSGARRTCEAHARNLAVRDKALLERDAQLDVLRATVARLQEENEAAVVVARQLESEKDRCAQLVGDVSRLESELDERSAALGAERTSARALKQQAEAVARLEAEEIAHLKARNTFRLKQMTLACVSPLGACWPNRRVTPSVVIVSFAPRTLIPASRQSSQTPELLPRQCKAKMIRPMMQCAVQLPPPPRRLGNSSRGFPPPTPKLMLLAPSRSE